MQTFLLVAGFAVLGVVVLDAFVSTISAQGAGPISGPLTTNVWRVALWIHRHRPSHRLLQITGVLTLIAAVTSWILLIWFGWVLVFSAIPEHLVHNATGMSADLPERIYTVGYIIFTLGNGEFSPDNTVSRIFVDLAVLSGLFLVTLGITYLLPVVQAASEKRQIALQIKGLGETPQRIVEAAWNGKDFSALTTYLSSLTGPILLLGQRHLAYPVLHYYHTTTSDAATLPRIAALDEAITIIACGIDADSGIPEITLRSVREAISTELETVRALYLTSLAEGAPPALRLHRLKAKGIPVVEQAVFEERLRDLEQHRRALLGAVKSTGWSWTDVLQGTHDKPEKVEQDVEGK